MLNIALEIGPWYQHDRPHQDVFHGAGTVGAAHDIANGVHRGVEGPRRCEALAVLDGGLAGRRVGRFVWGVERRNCLACAGHQEVGCERNPDRRCMPRPAKQRGGTGAEPFEAAPPRRYSISATLNRRTFGREGGLLGSTAACRPAAFRNISCVLFRNFLRESVDD